MKKLVTVFLASLLLLSCNSDDNSDLPNVKGELVMTVNTKETYTHKPVYFTVRDINGAYSTLLVNIASLNNEQLVADNGRYKPSKPGEFTFIAKAKKIGSNFKDSAPVTIKVKEPTNKIFSIKGTTYPVAKASLKIKRLRNTLSNGKEEIQDLIHTKGENEFYNEYVLEVSGGSPYHSTTRVTFLVKNETVKSENGHIYDYGKRVLPSQVETTIITQIITDQSNGAITVNDIYAYPNTDLEFYYLDPVKDDIATQVLPKSYFGLNFKSTIIDYVGELTFEELIIDN